MAAAAYQVLRDLESLDPKAIASVLKETLLGPLRTWQVFELALAVAMSRALADVTQSPLQVIEMTPGGTRIVFRIANFDVYWQSKTALFVDPQPEPSEVTTRRISDVYGVDDGSDRPDVVVVDRVADRVVAVGEAKYFTDEVQGWKPAIRDAVDQIVRYSRGFTDTPAALDALLAQCLIAVWSVPAEVRNLGDATVPVLVDFSSLSGPSITAWARRVVLP